MKILILASNPRKDLNLETEIRHLQGAIERSRNREYLEVEVGFAVRPEDLQGLLLKHEPDIVHFCGHGTGERGLVLQDDTLIEQIVSTDALSNLFKLCSRWVKCVLLNACYSEVQADAIVQHIDYAIGMHHEIRDDAAISFATGFYQALGYGQAIEQAYRFGCNAIQLQISDHSNFRSALSEEKRKLSVATTLERVVIPEHLKPVLKIKPNLTTNISKFTPNKKLDIQSYIDKALEKEIALRKYNQEFKEYLADKNIRFNSHSSSPTKARKLLVGGTIAISALVITSSFLYQPPQLGQDLEKSRVATNLTEMTAEDFLNRGWNEYEKDDIQGAIKNYNQAIELKPDYSSAYYNRGIVYVELGEYQSAIKDYTQAIKIAPNNAHFHYSRGLAYFDLKEYQKAIADYTQAIEMNSNYAYIYYSRGLAYSNVKEHRKAIEDYQKAAKLYQQKGNEVDYQDALDRINELQQQL